MQHDHSNPARRNFLRNTLIASAAALPLSQLASAQAASSNDNALPESMRALKSVAAQVVPISNDERIARVAKAQRLMAEHGINCSMSRSGNVWDNAAMESFFSLLQKNVLDRQPWRTRQELRLAIVSWIEGKYHRKRRQRRLGKLTPVEFETIMMDAVALAA